MKVYHPTIEGLVEEVSKDSVEEWAEQGWLKSEPKRFKNSDDSAAS